MATKIPVEQYLNVNLFEELGLGRLTPEEQASFLETIGGVIQQRLTLRLMEILTDAQKDKLEAILENGQNDAALGEFLSKEVPNFQDIANEEVATYKKQLIDRMKS